MANFPQNPSVNDTHQIGDKIWTWDGEKWFADYESLSPVFQAKNDEGMVDTDAGSDFKLALDADLLTVLNNPAANTIGNVIVTGDQSPIVGSTKIYSFNIDGTVNDEVGTYTCDVPGAVVTLNQIQFSTVGTGKVYVEVNSVTATDSPVNAEMDINVVAVPDTIGTITITGNDNPDKMDTVTYGYTIDGTATNDTAVMTAVGAGASVIGNDVTWTGSGAGEVKFEVTAPGASDDPKSATLDVNVNYVREIGIITLSGNSNPAQNTTETYSAIIDGDVQTVTVSWTADSALGVTPNPVIPGAFDFTGANVGATGDITVTYTSGSAWDSPKSESISVTVAAAPVTDTIGNVTINGDLTPTVGDTVTYSYDISGNAGDGVGVLTTDIAGATVNGDDITFAQTGSGYVQYEVTATATDSPVTKQENVVVAAGPPPPGIPITGDTSVDLTTATDVDNPDQYAYAIPWSTTNQSWSVESDVFEWIPVFNHSGTTADCEITNSFAMFDGDETRPTTFDWKNTGTDVVRISFNKDVFPSGTHNLEILVQETTGDKIGFNLTHDQDNIFTQCPAQVCLTPTWLTSTRAVNWKDHFQDIIINNETWNSFVRVFAIKVDNQIVRLNRPVQVDNYGAQGACFYYGPANYKVKCTFKNNGYDYDEVLDVTATGYPPLKTVTPRTATASSTTYTVTVTNTGYGNKYVIDGVQQDSLTLTQGNTYIFDQSDSSNSGHPLKIYTDSSKSTEVTAGVTIGSNSTTFVPGSTGTYSYQCGAHANMGGDITVQ